MNILPKKSWHVRTKKNIERVRRDEEKAAEEEKEQQRRIALAEQEARTDLLRHRSRKRQHDEIEAPSSSTAGAVAAPSEAGSLVVKASTEISLNQGGHINFFKDIEQGLRREGKNKEHEAERAAEKEKWEKNIGLLTYLGQSAIESQNDKPWYLQKSELQKAEPRKASPYEPKQSKREDRDKRLKDSMDPLKDMKRHLEKRHKHKHHKKEKPGHPPQPKQSKHDRHPQSTSSKSAPSSSSQSQPKKSKTIEELRAERLRRELAERQKVAAVIARAKGEPSGSVDDADAHVSDADRDRSRGYNSRYNPNFVKPMSKRR